MADPPRRYENLARKTLDLDLLAIPGAERRFDSGKAVIYRLPLSPSEASRIYACELIVWPGTRPPEMYVLHPDLTQLADGRKVPHTYPSKREGTRLCLYLPKGREWTPEMKLSETFIPWTLRWLWYFEIWSWSGKWEGGGVHPDADRRRYGVNAKRRKFERNERAEQN